MKYAKGGLLLWRNGATVLLLAVLFVCLMMISGSADAETEGDYEYTVDSEDKATITGYTGAGGVLTIPSTLGGKTVIAIGEKAFYENTAITSVTIQSGVTTIGDLAFNSCTNLTSVTLSDSVTTIGSYVFARSGITQMTLGASITSIGSSIFSGCASLSSVTYTPTFNSIPGETFYECTSLASFTIPSTVTMIDSRAFYGCAALGSITIPNLVTEIGNGAFQGCASLTEITIPSAVESIGTGIFMDCTKLATVIFEEGIAITHIPGEAFKNCASLINIVIPSTVTSIGNKSYQNYTFEGCTSLKTITIPDAVTMLGAGTFKNCTSLEEVKFTENSLLESLGEGNTFAGIYVGCSSLKTVYMPKLIDVPVDGDDFEGCTSLESFEVHEESERFIAVDGVLFRKSSKVVEEETVYYPSGLYIYPAAKAGDTYKVPATVTSLTKGSFQYCSLKEIDLGETSITTLNSGVFKGCSELTTLIIPTTVTSISDDAFEGCTSISSFTVAEGNTKYSSIDGVLYDASARTLVRYPIAKVGTAYTIPNTVKTVNAGAFEGCSSLQTITMSCADGFLSIGAGAFEGCSSLKAIYLPSAVGKVTVGSGAFSGCHEDLRMFTCTRENCDRMVAYDSDDFDEECNDFSDYSGDLYLAWNYGDWWISFDSKGDAIIVDHTAENVTELTVPTTIGGKNVVKLGYALFKGYVSLVSIVLPDTIVEFDTDVFVECAALTTVNIPTGLEILSDDTFRDCTSLVTVTLPSGLTEIGNRTFMDCNKLKQIALPDSVTTIRGNAFQNCTALENVTIGESSSLFWIYGSAFENCSALKSISLPSSMSIYSNAFKNCKSLTSFAIPAMHTIPSGMLEGCTSLKSVTIPEGVSVIDSGAFKNCRSLETLSIPKNVYSIGFEALLGLDSLTAVNVDPNNKKYHSNGGALYQDIDTGNELILYPSNKSDETFTVEEGTRWIHYLSLLNNPFLKTLNLPASLDWLGTMLDFKPSGCVGLETITIPESNEHFVTEDGILYDKEKTVLFWYPAAKAGTDFTVPATVVTIGDSAFDRNKHLVNVTLADATEAVLVAAFNSAESLKVITLGTSLDFIDGSVFEGCDSLEAIKMAVPEEGRIIEVSPDQIGYMSDKDLIQPISGTYRIKITYEYVSADENYHVEYSIGLPSYDVVFDANGGTGTMDSLNIDIGESKALTMNTFVYALHTFTSWNTKADGSGTSYNDGATVSDLSTTDGATVTLYAQWAPIEYTVNFHANGGNGSMDSQTLTHGVRTKLAANAFTHVDMTFVGWNTFVDGTGTAFTDQQEIVNAIDPDGGDVDLYAQWVEIGKYTITFNNTGDSIIHPIVAPAGTVITKPADPVWFGHTFSGWDRDIPDKMPEENMVISGTWAAAIVKITFDFNYEGDSDVTVDHKFGETIKFPSIPTREGYSFYLWTYVADDSDHPVPENTVVDFVEAKTLYGFWHINEYTITFLNYDGTEFHSDVRLYDEVITVPATNPLMPADDRFTYAFHAWTGYVEGMKVKSDITFYPVFIASPSSIPEPVEGVVELATPVDMANISNFINDIATGFDDGSVTTFNMQFEQGSIGMDGAAFGSLDEDGLMGVVPIGEESYPSEIKDKVSDRPVFEVFIGGIHTFEGQLKITFKYTLGEGEDASNLRVWHFNAEGDYVEESCTYDSEKGEISFTTDNLSYFSIMHIEQPSDPGNGNGMNIGLIVGIVVAVVAVAGVGAFFFMRGRN